MPTVSGFWVRVVDGQVKGVRDIEPTDGLMMLEPEWEPAVEITFETFDEFIECRDGHTFNLSTTPKQIVYNKKSLTIEEIKTNMINSEKFKFSGIVSEQTQNQISGGTFDTVLVENARNSLTAKIISIESATSIDELRILRG
jgi:hypothetical protein